MSDELIVGILTYSLDRHEILNLAIPEVSIISFDIDIAVGAKKKRAAISNELPGSILHGVHLGVTLTEDIE